MPRESYEELLTPLNEGVVGGVDNKDIEFDGKNLEAVVTLLDFLEKRLDVVRHISLLLLPRPFQLLYAVDVSYETPPFNPVLHVLH